MRDRDEADYTAFVESAWPRLFRSAYALTGDYQHAEDALQSALAKAYSSWRRVNAANSPEAYVRRMVANEVLGWWRRSSWRREHVSEDLDHVLTESHEDRLLRADEVWQALGALPPRQRAVIVLRYYDDLSEKEIAETLNIRPGTVKSQASAALVTLRRTLGADQVVMNEEKP